MSAVAESFLSAVLAAIDEDPAAAASLAERLAPYLPKPARAEDNGGWLDTQAAAEYLGIRPKSLQTLVAERALEFSQAGPGARCYFERAELDAYRRRYLQGRGCR